jgi:hypothetical protein
MRIGDQERADRLGLPFAGEITFYRDKMEFKTQVLTENISATGGYFVANTLLKTGDLVKVQLYWHPRKEPEIRFSAVGKVSRVDPLLKKIWGVAVGFEDPPEWQ